MNQRGLSLLEIVVGAGISTIVLTATISVMTMVNTVSADGRLQSLVNQLYFQGARVVQTPQLFVDRIPGHPNPLGLSAAQIACLGSKGSGCRAFDGRPDLPVPSVVDPTLNANFNQAGVCQASDPNCQVARTTTWRMVCASDQACAGLRVNLNAHVIAPGAPTGARLRDRQGLIFIPARQFVAKQNVTFQCAASGVQMIFAIDYLNRVDVCSQFNAGPGCPRPMNTFASPDNCQRNQAKSCGDGFSTIGYFASQESCI